MGTMPSSRICLLTSILLVTVMGAVSAQSPVRSETRAEPVSLASVEGGMTIREWLEAIGEAFDIEVVFDPRMRGTQDTRVELSLQDVGLEEALDRACTGAGLMWVALDERSVVVAEDNPQMRRRYEPMVVQTFYLENADTRDAITLLRSMIGVRNVAAVQSLNAVTVRDTVGRVALAEELLRRHDRAPAVLEIDVRLVQLSAGDLERVAASVGGSLPPRPGAEATKALLATGRVLAQPILSLADGAEAGIRIGPSSADKPAFELTVSARHAASDGAITVQAGVEGDSAGEERRRQISELRLEAGETWVLAGLLRASDGQTTEPDHLVVLLTPRIASPATVEAADHKPLAVGTEAHLGLERDEP